MVDVEKCRRDAERRIRRALGKEYAITHASQTDALYVFSAGRADRRITRENLPMYVYDKTTGDMHVVTLPSEEGFAIIDDERPLDTEGGREA